MNIWAVTRHDGISVSLHGAAITEEGAQALLIDATLCLAEETGVGFDADVFVQDHDAGVARFIDTHDAKRWVEARVVQLVDVQDDDPIAAAADHAKLVDWIMNNWPEQIGAGDPHGESAADVAIRIMTEAKLYQ